MSGRPLRVLVVEDSADDVELLVRELERGGFQPTYLQVQTAEMMRAALSTQRWDVILSDHAMPRFDAHRALEVLQGAGVDIPFIIVSAILGEDAAVEAMRAGAHDYLVKGQLKRLVPAIERELRDARVRAERQRAEVELRQSEARFRGLMERLPDLVLVLREGLVLFANPAAVRALGHASPEALVGRRVEELVHPQDAAAVRDVGAGPGAAGDLPRRVLEQRWVRKDGAPFRVEVLAQSVVFDDAWAVVLVARDVEAQRQVQAQLLLSDRMVAMGTLAAGVAHEINNPLAVVLANLDYLSHELGLLRSQAPEGAVKAEAGARLVREAATLVEESSEAARRVRDIVRDLKTLSRPDEESRGPVDITSVLDTSLRMARNEIRHRARVVRDYDSPLFVHGNEARLGQVFLNLLVNAAQAMPEGRANEQEIRLSARREGGQVRVEVRDTGSGIPPDVLPRIFDAFFTTKPVGVGTGLGLAITQRIVSELGGSIDVRSASGKGTTFLVQLPAFAEGPGGAPTPPVPELPTGRDPASRPRPRVLVVDDEPAVRKVVERALAREAQVTAVGHAQEALATLRGGEPFDVILCDLMMPDITGMELYATLARELPAQAARVVFLTGGAFTPEARAFLEGRRPRTLEKPFGVKELLAVVREASG